MEGLSLCFVGRCAPSSIVAAGYLVAQVALGILRASVRIKTVGVGNRSDLEKGETALLDTRESEQRNCVPEAGNRPLTPLSAKVSIKSS